MDWCVNLLLETKHDTRGLLWVDWRAYRDTQQVARLAGQHDLVDEHAAREEMLTENMPLFLEAGKWFVGGLKSPAGLMHLSTGRFMLQPFKLL